MIPGDLISDGLSFGLVIKQELFSGMPHTLVSYDVGAFHPDDQHSYWYMTDDLMSPKFVVHHKSKFRVSKMMHRGKLNYKMTPNGIIPILDMGHFLRQYFDNEAKMTGINHASA